MFWVGIDASMMSCMPTDHISCFVWPLSVDTSFNDSLRLGLDSAHPFLLGSLLGPKLGNGTFFFCWVQFKIVI